MEQDPLRADPERRGADRGEAYGRRAAVVYAWVIDPLLGRLRRRILQACASSGTRTVVDIACATGAQCRVLHAAGLEVTGVDLSASMLAQAGHRSSPKIRYVRASALSLPFDDGLFDAAILSLALHEHPEGERRGMLHEAVRATRPDGVILLADYRRPRLACVHPVWRAIRAIERSAGGDHEAGFRDFMDQGGVDGLVRRLGLPVRASRGSHGGAIGIVTVGADADIPVANGSGGG